MRRVVPAIGRLAGCGARLSIDSRNAAVMAAALDAGAAIVNDVSALTHDPASLDLVARSGVPRRPDARPGDPRTMQDAPAYDHVALDVFDYLEARIAACEAAGIARDAHRRRSRASASARPLEHNLALLRDLALFHGLGCAVLLGASRKSFIGRLAGAGRRGPQRGCGGSAGRWRWPDCARRVADSAASHDVADTPRRRLAVLAARSKDRAGAT